MLEWGSKLTGMNPGRHRTIIELFTDIRRPRRMCEGGLQHAVDQLTISIQVGDTENDGQKLFSRLRCATTAEDVSRLCGSIEGP